MDIPASWRYSSKIADYTTRYTGLYHTYRACALIEYFKVEPDDGLICNLGTNPLLQISSASDRGEILQGIINRLSSTAYTPFEVEIPENPSLDPMQIPRSKRPSMNDWTSSRCSRSMRSCWRSWSCGAAIPSRMSKRKN